MSSTIVSPVIFFACGAWQARSYLEEHNILPFVERLLKTLVQENADPTKKRALNHTVSVVALYLLSCSGLGYTVGYEA